jgi:hypothetical protein
MKRKTEPLVLDKDPDYISPPPMREGSGELVEHLKSMLKHFVPNTEFHNKLIKAIKLANP